MVIDALAGTVVKSGRVAGFVPICLKSGARSAGPEKRGFGATVAAALTTAARLRLLTGSIGFAPGLSMYYHRPHFAKQVQQNWATASTPASLPLLKERGAIMNP